MRDLSYRSIRCQVAGGFRWIQVATNGRDVLLSTKAHDTFDGAFAELGTIVNAFPDLRLQHFEGHFLYVGGGVSVPDTEAS